MTDAEKEAAELLMADFEEAVRLGELDEPRRDTTTSQEAA